MNDRSSASLRHRVAQLAGPAGCISLSSMERSMLAATGCLAMGSETARRAEGADGEVDGATARHSGADDQEIASYWSPPPQLASYLSRLLPCWSLS